MNESYQWIVDTIERGDTTVYGVNTGFGSLARERIALEQTRQLSRNLILTCLVNVGEPLSLEIVRAMMLRC
jgi:histidine ammonia-lyase